MNSKSQTYTQLHEYILTILILKKLEIVKHKENILTEVLSETSKISKL